MATISFVGSAATTTLLGTTINLSATGRTSGDLILLIDQAFTVGSVPGDVTPTGFTRIGTSNSGTDAGTGIGYRCNAWWKISAGTEGSITCMTAGNEKDTIAFVFRSTGGTWQTPTSIISQVNLSSGVTSNQTVTALTAPFVAIGSANALNSTQDYASTPTADAQVFNTFSLTMAYNIFNTGGSNLVITGSANRGVIQGFAVQYLASGGFSAAIGETAAATNTQTALFNAPRSIAETAAATDSQTAIANFFKSVSETAAATDSQASTTNFPKSVSESAAATDAQTAIFGAQKAVAETAAATDSQTAITNFLRSVAESAAIADSQTAAVPGDFTASVSETVAATDSVTAVFDGGQASRGGISWKPEKDYQWPDLKSEIRQAVEDIARRSSQPPEAEQIVPEVVEAVRATVPALPSINLQQLIFEITSAILDVQMAEDEEAAAMLLLCE